MALRNAFADLGLESTLRSILGAVTMPRDAWQRQRVVIDGGSVNVNGSYVSAYFGAANTVPGRYSSGAATGFDARDWQQQNSEAMAMQVHSRWTVT